MKIKLLCPKCGREEDIKRLWEWLFKEDYIDFKKIQKEQEDNYWKEEVPKIWKQIEEKEQKVMELEALIDDPKMQEILLKMKTIWQEIQFLYERLKYNNERKK